MSEFPSSVTASSVESHAPQYFAPASAAVPSQGVRSWLSFGLGVCGLIALLLLLGRFWRTELEAVGHAFVGHFGLFGLALGAFVADAFHFPLPAQFYMLLSIAAGNSPSHALVALSVGSLLGGTVGYFLGQRLSRLTRVERWLTRSGVRIQAYMQGPSANRSALAVSLSPFAFSVLCWVSGLYQLRRSAFLVVLALRLPKLLAYYALIQLGWGN